MTSSIPAVKAAIVTVLRAALPSTQVIYGGRGAVTTLSPRVCLVGRVIGRRDPDAMSLDSSAELYAVEIVCSVSLATTDQQLADEQVLADYAAGEAAIRADPTLGGLALSAVPRGEIELAEIADELGRHAAARWTVNVYAQTL